MPEVIVIDEIGTELEARRRAHDRRARRPADRHGARQHPRQPDAQPDAVRPDRRHPDASRSATRRRAAAARRRPCSSARRRRRSTSWSRSRIATGSRSTPTSPRPSTRCCAATRSRQSCAGATRQACTDRSLGRGRSVLGRSPGERFGGLPPVRPVGAWSPAGGPVSVATSPLAPATPACVARSASATRRPAVGGRAPGRLGSWRLVGPRTAGPRRASTGPLSVLPGERFESPASRTRHRSGRATPDRRAVPRGEIADRGPLERADRCRRPGAARPGRA